MLNRLPRHMPPLAMMLADIGNPTPAQLAKALGVSRASVYRWMRAEQAPRAVMLALFWLTRWGMSQVDCEAVNTAALHIGMGRALRSRIEALEADLARLGRLADFGSANDPLPSVPTNPIAPPVVDVAAVPVQPARAPRRPHGATKKTARSNRAN